MRIPGRMEGKIIGEQEVSWKIYEDIAEILSQFSSLDSVSSIILARDSKDKIFMAV